MIHCCRTVATSGTTCLDETVSHDCETVSTSITLCVAKTITQCYGTVTHNSHTYLSLFLLSFFELVPSS